MGGSKGVTGSGETTFTSVVPRIVSSPKAFGERDFFFS